MQELETRTVGRDEEIALSANALRVLEKRYLAKDESGRVIETPDEMFRRVARNLAEADRLYDPAADLGAVEEEFYRVMRDLLFMPNSPTLMNAGRDLQQLAACFVLPVGDSMEEIFTTVKHAAIIHKSGGGTGFSFSRLRPKDDVVRSTGGVASGPVSFMKVFNHATEAVKQGGTRRGANMGILRVDHPDILDFITCKSDTKEVTNFNISVAVTDAFMEAVEQDTTYPLLNPRNGQPVRHVRAREVLEKIAQQAWQNGEPGLFFVDAANRANPTPHVATFEATNPCGEQPLLPYESCNLGSVNLERHLTWSDGRWEVDWAKLDRTTRTSTHLLDNVIDMNRYPVPEIERITKANRKIGLGVMGFARLLFKLGIPYDSDEGVAMGRRVMRFVRDRAYEASAALAEARGVYANWPGSMHERRGVRLRNSYVTTVAPTGTICMIADTSGGCEPEFSLIWYKNVMDGEHLPYMLEDFFEVAKREGFWTEHIVGRIVENHGACRGLAEVPRRWQQVFATSHDVAPEWHVKMQAAFQESTDSAVSKTINLPATATVEDVTAAYLQAFRSGCKGITVYRDASRPDQVMNLGVSGKSEAPAAGNGTSKDGNGSGPAAHVSAPTSPASGRKPEPRPEVLRGTTVRIQTAHGALYITVNEDEQQRPFEVFCSMGKAGSCEHSFIEAIGRLISLALRCDVDPQAIVRQLYGIRCGHPYGVGPTAILSGADAIAKGMKRYVETRHASLSVEGAQPPLVFAHPCPDCGCELDLSEHCEKCHFCGFSRCD